MAGSAAEERIRAKAETMLRTLFPAARIVHELVLQQGGVRIDLAAIGPSFIAAVEIKSERDVLERLPAQAEMALRVTDLFGVCVAASHAEKISTYISRVDDQPKVRLPYRAHLLVENEEGFDTKYSPFDLEWGGRDRIQARLCNPADRLEMLWASELKQISRSGMSRQPAKYYICETMNGREIREAVCATLRARRFPRADAAIPLPLPGVAA